LSDDSQLAKQLSVVVVTKLAQQNWTETEIKIFFLGANKTHLLLQLLNLGCSVLWVLKIPLVKPWKVKGQGLRSA